MATVTPTREDNGTEPNVTVWTWVLTTANTDGLPIKYPQHADLCWQVEGTFGGATAAVEGSNAGTVFAAMTNASGGAAATFAAAGLKTTIERPLYVRPNLTTPGAGATLNVTLTARKQPQPRF